MVNKQGLWFLTLTSLALVLSVYYITMPNELLISNNSSFVSNEDISKNEQVVNDTNIQESDIVTSMRVDLEQERLILMNELQNKLANNNLTVDEKNEIYEDLRYISELATKEESLRKKIKDEFQLDSFVKIDGDTISVTIRSKEHDKNLVVNIMKSLQEEFSSKMYISISFKE